MKMKSNGARKTPRFLFQAFLLKKKEGKGENQRNQNDSESKKEGIKLNIGGVWRFEDQLE